MASSIDETKPTATTALTADVRANFSAAKTEIEALQTDKAALADLSSTATGKGDELIAVKKSFTASVATTQHEINERELNVFDFMTAAEIADVIADTALVDVTAAIQLAINETIASGVAGNSSALRFPKGTYLISSTLSFPNSTRVYGDGRWATVFKAASGFTGAMLADLGNASKIILEDFQVNSNAESGVTACIKMGYTVPFGTEGHMAHLFLRGGSTSTTTNVYGLDVVGNVAFFESISSWYCKRNFNEGPNSSSSVFNNCVALGATEYEYNLNTSSRLIACELEAPEASCTPVNVQRSAAISGLIFSPLASTTNTSIITIDASAHSTALTVDGLFIHAAAGATQTTIIDDNRASPYAWSDQTARPGMYSCSDSNVGSFISHFVDSQKMQNFVVRIHNNAGTIEHKITGVANETIVSGYQDKINNATATYVNTPTGADASTAMANGGKISSASTYIFVLDTNAQPTTDDKLVCMTSLVYNTTTTDLTVLPTVNNRDVNGTTIRRLELGLRNSTTGANYALTGMPSGSYLWINVMCYIQ